MAKHNLKTNPLLSATKLLATAVLTVAAGNAFAETQTVDVANTPATGGVLALDKVADKTEANLEGTLTAKDPATYTDNDVTKAQGSTAVTDLKLNSTEAYTWKLGEGAGKSLYFKDLKLSTADEVTTKQTVKLLAGSRLDLASTQTAFDTSKLVLELGGYLKLSKDVALGAGALTTDSAAAATFDAKTETAGFGTTVEVADAGAAADLENLKTALGDSKSKVALRLTKEGLNVDGVFGTDAEHGYRGLVVGGTGATATWAKVNGKKVAVDTGASLTVTGFNAGEATTEETPAVVNYGSVTFASSADASLDLDGFFKAAPDEATKAVAKFKKSYAAGDATVSFGTAETAAKATSAVAAYEGFANGVNALESTGTEAAKEKAVSLANVDLTATGAGLALTGDAFTKFKKVTFAEDLSTKSLGFLNKETVLTAGKTLTAELNSGDVAAYLAKDGVKLSEGTVKFSADTHFSENDLKALGSVPAGVTSTLATAEETYWTDGAVTDAAVKAANTKLGENKKVGFFFTNNEPALHVSTVVNPVKDVAGLEGAHKASQYKLFSKLDQNSSSLDVTTAQDKLAEAVTVTFETKGTAGADQHHDQTLRVKLKEGEELKLAGVTFAKGTESNAEHRYLELNTPNNELLLNSTLLANDYTADGGELTLKATKGDTHAAFSATDKLNVVVVDAQAAVSAPDFSKWVGTGTDNKKLDQATVSRVLKTTGQNAVVTLTDLATKVDEWQVASGKTTKADAAAFDKTDVANLPKATKVVENGVLAVKDLSEVAAELTKGTKALEVTKGTLGLEGELNVDKLAGVTLGEEAKVVLTSKLTKVTQNSDGEVLAKLGKNVSFEDSTPAAEPSTATPVVRELVTTGKADVTKAKNHFSTWTLDAAPAETPVPTAGVQPSASRSLEAAQDPADGKDANVSKQTGDKDTEKTVAPTFEAVSATLENHAVVTLNAGDEHLPATTVKSASAVDLQVNLAAKVPAADAKGFDANTLFLLTDKQVTAETGRKVTLTTTEHAVAKFAGAKFQGQFDLTGSGHYHFTDTEGTVDDQKDATYNVTAEQTLLVAGGKYAHANFNVQKGGVVTFTGAGAAAEAAAKAAAEKEAAEKAAAEKAAADQAAGDSSAQGDAGKATSRSLEVAAEDPKSTTPVAETGKEKTPVKEEAPFDNPAKFTGKSLTVEAGGKVVTTVDNKSTQPVAATKDALYTEGDFDTVKLDLTAGGVLNVDFKTTDLPLVDGTKLTNVLKAKESFKVTVTNPEPKSDADKTVEKSEAADVKAALEAYEVADNHAFFKFLPVFDKNALSYEAKQESVAKVLEQNKASEENVAVGKAVDVVVSNTKDASKSALQAAVAKVADNPKAVEKFVDELKPLLQGAVGNVVSATTATLTANLPTVSATEFGPTLSPLAFSSYVNNYLAARNGKLSVRDLKGLEFADNGGLASAAAGVKPQQGTGVNAWVSGSFTSASQSNSATADTNGQAQQGAQAAQPAVNAYGFSASAQSVFAGVEKVAHQGDDFVVANGFRAGGLLGYTRNSVVTSNEALAKAEAKVNLFQVGAYGNVAVAPGVVVDLLAGYGFGQVQGKRLNSTAGKVNDSEYNAHVVFGSLGVNYSLAAGPGVVTPYAKVTYTGTFSPDYTEKDGTNDTLFKPSVGTVELNTNTENNTLLTVKAQTNNSLVLDAGATYEVAVSPELRAYATLGVAYDVLANNANTQANFAAFENASFSGVTYNLDPFRVKAAVGVNYQVLENLDLTVGYQFSGLTKFQSHQGQAKLNFKF